MKTSSVCDGCLNTGVLSAELVRSNPRQIAVVVCSNHYDDGAHEKTVAAMKASSGLDVVVIRSEKPTPRIED